MSETFARWVRRHAERHRSGHMTVERAAAEASILRGLADVAAGRVRELDWDTADDADNDQA
jgi:hypothetical protein